MAEELIIWENLERTLEGWGDAYPLLLETELGNLRDIVKRARGLVAVLQERDHIHHTRASNAALHDHSSDISEKVRHDLSSLVYQADDAVNEILSFNQRTRLCRDREEENERENKRRLVQQVCHAIARSTKEVSLFLSSSNQLRYSKVMAGRVKKIGKEIDKKVKWLLEEPGSTNQLYQPDQRNFRHIGSIEPDQHTVTGRGNDKKKILDLLLEPRTNPKTSISVICMTGLPGVGKSALAKNIYDNQKIKSHFDLRMWIQVAQTTNEKEIVRGIVESCTNRRSNNQDSKVNQNDKNPFRDLLGCQTTSIATSSPNYSHPHKEIDIYERRLKREIRGKLYLLILDDVYLNEWQGLRNLLAGGAPGSRILITTRSTEVADLVKQEFVNAKVYPLQGLSESHSWILFKRRALVKEDFGDKHRRQSGIEIIDICKCVPLTIKIAASFLRGKSTEEWLSFTRRLRLSRDQGEDILEHVLHLSYSDLPPRLRACFEYSYLFPDDYTFNKQDLISLWIAQGYVDPDDAPHDNLDVDPDVDHDVDPNDDLEVDPVVDHDLDPNDDLDVDPDADHDVHPNDDLVVDPDVDPQSVGSFERAGEMYFMELFRRCFFEDVRTDDLGNILTCKMHHTMRKLASKYATGVAHIQVTDSSMIQITDPTTKHASINCRSDSLLKLSPLLYNGPNLRSLIFIKEPDCEIKMDNLISNQLISTYKRLRVLDLHDLGVNELPDSIGDQIHLRYVDVSKNDGLVTLPKSFTRLCNPQTLILNSCPKMKRLAIDFGLLVNLKRFEVDECESLTCMPQGLEKLTQLETLSRFVVGKEVSKETAHVGLKALGKLKLLRGRLAIHFTGDWMTNTAETTQALCTKENLVELKISWAQRTSDAQVPLEEEILAHESTLEKNLKPNEDLKILSIEGYKGNGFPSWANTEIASSLPNLVNISIEGCGNCQYLPPFGELAHLKKLTLRHMANVQFVEDTAFGNQELEQERPFFPSLQEFTLHNFYNLQGWQQEVASIQQTKTRFFPCLSKLRIWNCPKLISFPSFIGVSDINLQNVNRLLLTNSTKTEYRPKNNMYTINLHIKGCIDLKDFREVRHGFQGLRSLEHLMIDSCDALTSLAYDVGEITSLERLEIYNCKELDLSKDSDTPKKLVQQAHRVSSYLWSPWRNLKKLHHLRLRELPKMETLPDGLRHVKSLKTIWISACPSLGSLPEWISSLSALQYLRIESCLALKRLPEGLREIKSLMKVEITECPELIERCREHKGEDWLKIKHARVLLHKSRRYGYV